VNRESKESLRLKMREARDSFFKDNAGEHRDLSAQVCAQLASFLPDHSLCATYKARSSELDPSTLISLRPDCRFAFPKVEGEHLTFWKINDDSKFITGSFGVSEPVPETCEQIKLENCDFVFVPGLAFDRDGHRLGYGRGFYDRALKNITPSLGRPAPRKIGLAFKFQIQQSALPHDSHDETMDMVVSEDFIMQPLERIRSK